MQFRMHPSCTESFYRVENALDCLAFHCQRGNTTLIREYQGKVGQLIDLAIKNRLSGFTYVPVGELPYYAGRRRSQAGKVVH